MNLLMMDNCLIGRWVRSTGPNHVENSPESKLKTGTAVYNSLAPARAVPTPKHNLLSGFLSLLFWCVSVTNALWVKNNSKLSFQIFMSLFFQQHLLSDGGRHRCPCPSRGSSPWPRSHFPLLLLWLVRTSCVFLSQCLERAFSLEIELLMVRERKWREDRRKRQIRMEVVMGEAQQGGCLLSLKDDERDGRVRQMEMKMRFRTDFWY